MIWSLEKPLNVPVQSENISPQELTKFYGDSERMRNVKSIEFIPPQVGSGGFGMFRVSYKVATMKAE